jgi:NAD(P)-dependent dehydrogenase (short-subunit alcohol dehydrogenase family)
MFIYKGSTALITGASKGLGVTFAEELARRGADLVLVARSKDALQTLAARLTAQYGVKCYVIAADLANPRTIDDIYAELAETGVPVDLLINNAGLGLSGRFLDHDHSKEQASIQVNVQALVGLSQSVRQSHGRSRSGWNHQYRVKLGFPAAAVHGDLRRVESFRPPFWRSAATRAVPCGSSGHDGLSWTDGDQFFRGHADDNVRPIFRHA